MRSKELPMPSPNSPAVLDRLTRRRLIGAGAAGALGIGLAACGGGGNGSTAGGAATRVIHTDEGTVRVPAEPRRVVSIDPGFSWETLVGIGLTPVGLPVVVDSLVQPTTLRKVQGIPTVVSDAGEPELEKIAALEPDLILANAGGPKSLVAKLGAIAPVAAYAFNFPSDWVGLDHSYADAVNRTDRLASITHRYDQRVAAIKERYGKAIAGQKWALVTESSGAVYLWGARSSAGPVLSAAGAQFSQAAPGPSTPFTEISTEKLGELDDATVILYGAGIDGKPYEETAELLKQPLFKALPAARAGNVYPLPSWFAYCYADALAQLDGLEAACAELR
jgi:iron complex transport system substrate-binding protein